MGSIDPHAPELTPELQRLAEEIGATLRNKYVGKANAVNAARIAEGYSKRGIRISSELINKNVAVLVKIRKDDTGRFNDKNVIAAFSDKLPDGASSSYESCTAEDDGIPF